MIDTKKSICPHFLGDHPCGGCSFWGYDYSTEIDSKKENLKSKLNLTNFNIRVKNTPKEYALRTRFDFTFVKKSDQFLIGLYSQKDHDLVDIDQCQVLHPELLKTYLLFRQILQKHNPPIIKGSARIRLAPDLKRVGLWLDLANEDTKLLLVEKNFLLDLAQYFTIEIGQKKKRLNLDTQNQEQLKLTDPIPDNWFKTLDTPLKCAIASFTQPTWETADLMTEEILNWVQLSKPNHIIEYGCGIGQYTVPLVLRNYSVDIFENDLFAVECLKKNSLNSKNIRYNIKNYSPQKNSLAIVNPPRSGLQSFTETLMDPHIFNLIYISCYPDSLAVDLQKLSPHFSIQDIVLIDQFKRTPHYEVAVHLKRK